METSLHRPYRITLPDFSIAFVPFALLLSAALLAPENTLDLVFYRTVYTIWATTVLVTPALCAFALPGDGERQRTTWLLFWTFSFLAFLVHMAYAYLGVYEGSFKKFLAGQGVFPAITNIIFLLWWSLDLALAWFYHGNARWVQRQRIAAHVFIGLMFFSSTVVLKHGFVNVLGWIMTVSVLICLFIYIDARRAAKASKVAAQP
jgi:hypothetical protein